MANTTNRKQGGKPKKKIFLNRMKVKLAWVFIILVLLFVGLMVRIYYINATKGAAYEKRVLSQQQYDSLTIPYRRGDILDRNGTQLATSEKVYNLIVEPKNVTAEADTKIATIAAITTCFDITAQDLETYLTDEKSLYKVVLKKLSYDEVQVFKNYLKTDAGKDVDGVWFEEEYKRSYPNGTLACHVLGFTVSGNVGQGGIECYYNSELNGINGREYGYLNDDLSLERTVKSPVNGNNVVSTIDINIQRIVEEEAQKFESDPGAENVSVVVMDPNKGEVLAMYNTHGYDPNNAYDTSALYYQFDTDEDGNTLSEEQVNSIIENLSDEDKVNALNVVWRNFCVSDAFEPGSTFKPFTVCGALEEDVIQENSTFWCDGFQEFPGPKKIKCHKISGHGELDVQGALMQSCNDALMQIGEMEGPEIFDRYQEVFGFGLKTNIDLPGEANTKSLIFHADTLKPVELATSSFGQGLNVSMIQLITAFSSVINGGDYYQPHVVKQIVDENGSVVSNYEGTVLRKTISQETSDFVKEALFQVVENGTAQAARIEGYTIGGKTGTAEKLPRGNGKYIVSFIGFAPVEKPQVVVYVIIDEPHVDKSEVSGKATIICHDIMARLFPYMNIYQSNGEEVDVADPNAEEVATPIFEDTPATDDTTSGGNTDSTTGDRSTESTTEGATEATTEASTETTD